MFKELVFQYSSINEVDRLVTKLKDKIPIKKASLDDGLGYSLRNHDNTLELQVIPKKEGELFQVVIKARIEIVEEIAKEIFGKPKKISSREKSVLKVAEYISKLPLNITQEQLKQQLKLKFEMNNSQIQYYFEMIIKLSNKKHSYHFIKEAAKRISKE